MRSIDSAASRCDVGFHHGLLCLAAVLVWPYSAAAASSGDESPERFFPLAVAWETELGAPPSAAAGFDAEHAYIALRDGTVAAIRLRDGEQIWSVTQAAAFPPAADGSVVAVAHGASVTALGVADGKPLWSQELPADVSAPPLVAAGWLVAALADGQLLALDAPTGRQLWRRNLDGPLRAPPVFGGSRLFVPVDDGRLVALDVLSGATLWEQGLTGRPGPALPLDAVFVGTTGNYLYRLSLTSGRIDWRWRTGGDVAGAPVADRRRVYFASLDNMVWALDRRSGAQRWRQVLPRRPRAVAGRVGAALLVTGVAEELATFDLETGEPANVLTAPAELGGAPYVAPALTRSGLRMVVLLADGRLLGMRPPPPPTAIAPAALPPPLQPRAYGALESTPIEIGPVIVTPAPAEEAAAQR